MGTELGHVLKLECSEITGKDREKMNYQTIKSLGSLRDNPYCNIKKARTKRRKNSSNPLFELGQGIQKFFSL
jgi:hypothetical protein